MSRKGTHFPLDRRLQVQTSCIQQATTFEVRQGTTTRETPHGTCRAKHPTHPGLQINAQDMVARTRQYPQVLSSDGRRTQFEYPDAKSDRYRDSKWDYRDPLGVSTGSPTGLEFHIALQYMVTKIFIAQISSLWSLWRTVERHFLQQPVRRYKFFRTWAREALHPAGKNPKALSISPLAFGPKCLRNL